MITACSFLSFAVTLREEDDPLYQPMPAHQLGVRAAEPAGAVA
jgi:hypothetical protein